MDKSQESLPTDQPTDPALEAQGKQLAGPAPVTILAPREVPLATLDDVLGAHDAEPAPVVAPIPERLNKDGSVPKKRGRKPGQRTAPPPAPESAHEASGEAPPTGPEAAKLSPQQAAKLCANLTIHAGKIIFGPEIGEPSDDEPKMLHAAYKDYFDARGGFSVPPEVGLIIALGMYAAPRVMHEKSAPLRERVVNFVKKLLRWK